MARDGHVRSEKGHSGGKPSSLMAWRRFQPWQHAGVPIVQEDVSKGDADKNLDWLCRETQALTILNGAESAEGNLDAFLVVPANV